MNIYKFPKGFWCCLLHVIVRFSKENILNGNWNYYSASQPFNNKFYRRKQ